MSIGRNAPCPCGSGQKYKKCCASKDQLAKRVATTTCDVSEELAPDATVYVVWRAWRKAREVSDFNFLFDLIVSDSPLGATVGDRAAFVAACADGTAVIPTGERAAFDHLSIREGELAKLLQTVDADDPASPTVTCECIECRKTPDGWRLSGFETKVLQKAEKPEIGLQLFEGESSKEADE